MAQIKNVGVPNKTELAPNGLPSNELSVGLDKSNVVH
jgi:hypothetical protein